MELDTKQISEALARVSDQVKEVGEKALTEAKKGVAMAEAEKGRVDDLLVKQGANRV
jgi:hypothetical protein